MSYLILFHFLYLNLVENKKIGLEMKKWAVLVKKFYFWSKFVIYDQKSVFDPFIAKKLKYGTVSQFFCQFSIDKSLFLNKIYWQPGSIFCQRECTLH